MVAALAAAASLAAAAILGGDAVGEWAARLSFERLEASLAPLAEGARALGALAGREALIFAAGLLFGWTGAYWWRGRMLRRSSLILLDPRRADMPFLEGVRHVHEQDRTTRGESQAAALILDAARRGRLSVWQRAPSNLLTRLSRRQLRRTASQLSWVADAPNRELGVVERLTLVRAEVELLWPRTFLIQGVASLQREDASR